MIKRKWIILLYLLVWILFPYASLFFFSDIGVNSFYIYIFGFLYLLFWILPIIYFKEKKVPIIKLILFNICAFTLLIYLMSIYWNNILDEKSSNIIDIKSWEYLNEIKNTLKWNDSFSFINIDNYNEKFNKKIIPYHYCYYLSSIENNKWYIYAYKYESKKNIEKFWKDYFIYKSINNYVINEDFMFDIKNTINKECFK